MVVDIGSRPKRNLSVVGEALAAGSPMNLPTKRRTSDPAPGFALAREGHGLAASASGKPARFTRSIESLPSI